MIDDYNKHAAFQRQEGRYRASTESGDVLDNRAPKSHSITDSIPTLEEANRAAEDKFLGVKTGVVKSFGEYGKPGFGHLFDADKNEYFVHYSAIAGKGFKNLARGQHVKFSAYEGSKGLYAKEVMVITV